MGSNSVLELFLLFSKYYSIQELLLDDIIHNFKLLKEMDKYNDLLKEYSYNENFCPKLSAEIYDLIKYEKIILIDQLIIPKKINENILSQFDEKQKLLTLRMVEEFVSINTKKYNQDSYVKKWN